MDAKRVVVVEDHPLTRYVLRVFLADEPDIELAGECDGTGDVPSEVEAAHPDVVLLDYRLPVTRGDILTQQLKALRPNVKILGFSIDPDTGRPAMLSAGADGFLEKNENG